MSPQTDTCQVFLAACQGRSFLDPHCSCWPALLALISSRLQGMSPCCFPCRPFCPHWQPEDSLASPRWAPRGHVCKVEIVTATVSPSKAQVPVQTYIYEAAWVGVATKGVPSGAPCSCPSCCPGWRGAVRFLPPLLSSPSVSTAKAVNLEAVSFLSTSSPLLPASPDPVPGLLFGVHRNSGLGAHEPRGS